MKSCYDTALQFALYLLRPPSFLIRVAPQVKVVTQIGDMYDASCNTWDKLVLQRVKGQTSANVSDRRSFCSDFFLKTKKANFWRAGAVRLCDFFAEDF